MERGSSSVLGVVLPERGHGEVSAGEEIPVCSGGGMSPRWPRCGPGQAVCQPCMWRDAGIRARWDRGRGAACEGLSPRCF